MLNESIKKNKGKIFIFLTVLAVFLCGTFSVNAAAEKITIELEEQEYTKSDEVFLETPFTHDLLPVSGAANVNYYKAGNLLQTSFSVEKEGIYLVTLGYVMNHDFGVLQMKIDDTIIDSHIDLNNGGSWEAGSKKAGLIRLAKGEHTVSFISQEAAYYSAILDYLQLEELEVSDEILFEFEGNAYTKSDDFHLESNYSHEALPVDAVINIDFQGAGRSLETVSLVIPEAGKYKMTLAYILNNDSGTIQIEIDGQPAGEPVNLYHDGGWTLAEQELGEMDLAAGIHKITIKNADDGSGRYCARLDALRLQKTAAAENPIDPVIPDPGTDPTPKPDPNPGTGDSGAWFGLCTAVAALLCATAVCRRKNHG